MIESLFIHKDGEEYYIYELVKSREIDVHLVYNIETNKFYFEQYLYNFDAFSQEDSYLIDYSTCTEEELFMQSTLYEHSKYCTLERLSAIQKAIIEVYNTDPNKNENNISTFNRDIEY